MTMQTVFHSTYKGADIWRQYGGSALPWTALVPERGSVAADTLAGLKSLISRKLESA